MQVVPSRDWHLATFFKRVRNLPLNYTYSKILRNLGNEIAVSLSVTLRKVSCSWRGRGGEMPRNRRLLSFWFPKC